MTLLTKNQIAESLCELFHIYVEALLHIACGHMYVNKNIDANMLRYSQAKAY